MRVRAWSVLLVERRGTPRPPRRAPDGLAKRQRKGCDAAGSSRCNGFQSPPFGRPPSARALGASPNFIDSASEQRGARGDGNRGADQRGLRSIAGDGGSTNCNGWFRIGL